MKIKTKQGEQLMTTTISRMENHFKMVVGKGFARVPRRSLKGCLEEILQVLSLRIQLKDSYHGASMRVIALGISNLSSFTETP
jgi:hypothetical protein